jgi:hypothetical protein
VSNTAPILPADRWDGDGGSQIENAFPIQRFPAPDKEEANRVGRWSPKDLRKKVDRPKKRDLGRDLFANDGTQSSAPSRKKPFGTMFA